MQTAPLEKTIYSLRFSDAELRRAAEIWKRIASWLQPYVPASGTTLDLGAGYCHFINAIRSARKIAVDVNEENLVRYAASDVERITANGATIEGLAPSTIDTVFASNVYEHFDTRDDVIASLRRCYELLRPGGRLIILQPNFRYCYREYFDFFDHKLPFTHRAMAEGVEIAGFAVDRLIPRFLPYTSKGALPTHPALVELYLRVPLAWRILGGQMLIVARKPETKAGHSS